MASNTVIEINGTSVNPPADFADKFQIEFNFDRDSATFKKQTSLNGLDWYRENASLLNAKITNGLAGFNGVFSGTPIKIKKGTEVLYDGYIDCTKETTWTCNKVQAEAVERNSIDWLNSIADSVTFERLYIEGKITGDDFIFMPYVINTVPNYREAAICMLTVFVLGEQIKQVIQKIAELVSEMTNTFEATAIIRAVFYVIYVTTLIIALLKLLQNIILLIIQPVKYHAGMFTKDLFLKGCEHFGLTFKTNIFDKEPFSKEVIIPEKYYNPVSVEEDKILGFLTPDKNEQIGYFKGTFGDFIRAMKIKYDAKIIVTDSKDFYFVTQNFDISQPQYQLPPIEFPEVERNTSDLKSNILVSFEYDMQDKNTVQNYKGISYQVFHEFVTPPEIPLQTGYQNIRIPFARGHEKTELTVPEKIVAGFLEAIDTILNGIITGVNALIKVYNKVVKLINKMIKALGAVGINVNFEIQPIEPIEPVDISATIENRIGMLVLENDHFDKPKAIIIEQGTEPKYNKISSLNICETAKYHYENFHSRLSFVPSAKFPNANQWEVYNLKNIPFCVHDFLKVKNNNKIFDYFGNIFFVLSGLWSVENNTANLVVAQNKLYTREFFETYAEPDGK